MQSSSHLRVSLDAIGFRLSGGLPVYRSTVNANLSNHYVQGVRTHILTGFAFAGEHFDFGKVESSTCHDCRSTLVKSLTLYFRLPRHSFLPDNMAAQNTANKLGELLDVFGFQSICYDFYGF